MLDPPPLLKMKKMPTPLRPRPPLKNLSESLPPPHSLGRRTPGCLIISLENINQRLSNDCGRYWKELLG